MLAAMTTAILAWVALVCFVIERKWPAADLPKVEGWWLRVTLLNSSQLVIVLLAGVTWDKWFRQVSLFNLSQHLSPVLAGTIAYLVSCLIYYWWHRYRHESPFFWRLCHQLHHSPRRIELLTSFYKHPVEIGINSLLSSALVYLLLGCDLAAAAIYTFLIAIAEFFYHLNIKTPHWLGYIIQRPESHRVHHQRGRHTNNYADLPFLDMIFGTFINPKLPVTECGFAPQQEARIKEMLLTKDVSRTKAIQPTCLGCRKRWICASHK